LAEERALIGEIVVTPMAQQALGRGTHLPLRLRKGAPALHRRTDAVDDLGGIVFLPLAIVQKIGLVCLFATGLLRLWNRETRADLRRTGSMMPLGWPFSMVASVNVV
jgi:hypothetical protein